MCKETDSQLWASFLNDDPGALHQLYTQFVDVLYAFGLRYTDDTEVVKDGIQDLFIDLFKYRQTLAAEVNVKSYLYTSLKRKIFLLLKKMASEADRSFELPFLLTASVEDQIINAEEESELVNRLSKQLDLLPARQKQALYLRFNAEMEYEEISTIMDISLETCRTLVYRGVKQLRERMVVSHPYQRLA